MDSSSFKKPSDQRPIPVYISPSIDSEEEIGLIDLWRVVARRKWILLATFLASLVLAVMYLFVAQPVYKASAYLLPPQQQNIQGLLVDYGDLESFDIKRYTPELVYNTFLDNLKSLKLRRDFFDTHDLAKYYVSGELDKNITVDQVFDSKFNKNIQMLVDKDNPSFVTVTLSGTEPELIAQWLNQIIDFANRRTVHQLFSDVNSAIQSEVNQVRYQLDGKLKLAEQRRRDTIIRLNEALQIARELGIKDANTSAKVGNKIQAGLTVNTAQAPLYLRGIEALEAEIAVLEARKSDESFINGFRDLQERRAFLERISIDPDSLSAVTVDEAARVPYTAERPRKALVLVLTAVLGITIGLIAIFLLEFLSKLSSIRSSDTLETPTRK